MKFPSVYLFFLIVALSSCNNDNTTLLAEQQKEAKKRKTIFNTINRGWDFNLAPVEPTTQNRINSWMEWRNFLTEINQKPKGTIGAFQKKAQALGLKVIELNNNIPSEFDKPQTKARIAVITTKIKLLDLYIHLNQIPDNKVVKLIGEINMEVEYFQLQLEEIVKRSLIPLEEGEPDILSMKDSTRAVPSSNTDPDLE